ncbi:MAG: 3-deoxy-D-manno-octulosonate 8-phosphate phosphatase [Flammeovirgaceae bacterium]|nr:3-deoxy-D-manno-octulosonate 8-phosphate phosphatase [Flammeovirgaceae bacterium]|tara:strand:- start:816 stop:1295 length:480 start_codon:yes stop_codon:yes gene_type:complete
MKVPKIKMLVLDVDGTMTDNGIYIDENGVESKRYNAKDGVGIYELIKNNILIGIISHSEKGDGIKSRASYLGISHCYVGNEPKDKILLEWIKKEKILIEEVAFIGDDINDMSIIDIVGFSACPIDASDLVKNNVSLILESKGGYGCVREFSDLYLSQNS